MIEMGSNVVANDLVGTRVCFRVLPQIHIPYSESVLQATWGWLSKYLTERGGNLLFRAQNLQDCSNCAKNRAPDSSWVVIDDIIWVWSKSPSELGDTGGGSWKPFHFPGFPAKSLGVYSLIRRGKTVHVGKLRKIITLSTSTTCISKLRSTFWPN